MRITRNDYKKDWNNESNIEHNLTHHCSDVQRRFVGKIDFFTPSKALIEKETASEEQSSAIWEDAADCAQKLNFLMLAQKASGGIHRANSNAGLKIFCAIQYYCEGEAQRAIGNMIDKRHAVVDRYIDRFTDWSSLACTGLAGKIRPEQVIDFCKTQQSLQKLSSTIDQLRIELTDLFHDLLEAASNSSNESPEVYLQEERYHQTDSISNVSDFFFTF